MVTAFSYVYGSRNLQGVWNMLFAFNAHEHSFLLSTIFGNPHRSLTAAHTQVVAWLSQGQTWQHCPWFMKIMFHNFGFSNIGRNFWLNVKNSNRFHNNFADASHFFVHFFVNTAWLWRESAQFYILWKEKHKTTTFLFSLWTLIESSEFNSRKMFCLTNESTKKVEKNILTAQDTTGPGF